MMGLRLVNRNFNGSTRSCSSLGTCERADTELEPCLSVWVGGLMGSSCLVTGQLRVLEMLMKVCILLCV